jgi:outer membrane protein assembly factor BamD (BamD/ComL family)
MFKKLFPSIATFQFDEVKITYNEGVNALARSDLTKAIPLFESICHQPPII